MVYVIALSAEELDRIDTDLRIKQSFTKTVAVASLPRDQTPRITLLVTRASAESDECPLVWLGVVRRPRGEKVAAVDSRITVELVRECPVQVLMRSFLDKVPRRARHTLMRALSGEVTVFGDEDSEDVLKALARQHDLLRRTLDFLGEAAEPDPFDPRRAEDRSWQEQYDMTRLGLAIGNIPPARLAAWRRPSDPNAPHLAGLIPEPFEQGLIENDARHIEFGDDVFTEAGWPSGNGPTGASFRCDIQVFEHLGSRIEVANINATPVEGRLGADLIYYHEATQSFILVQAKRLPPAAGTRWMYVDKQLLGQLDRLDEVAALSRAPRAPHEWRLGTDPCFVKLAYWPLEETVDPGPAPGMFLPVPYVRLLLEDDATQGPNGGTRLGYGYVDRYLGNTEFTALVKNGLVGTVGTTLDELRTLGMERAEEGMSVSIVVDRATAPPRETVKERHKRNHARGYDKNLAARMRRRQSRDPGTGQQSLFGP
ncbi:MULTISPECIES: hypothetical protein [Streptomyces]|uniref:DUF4263 domain-containing protein n=1 Tax=Streptomyces lonegramiae TaxID=3075524 RepID=A0ABU2XW30_9ACTN|nr:hypothetical protein [Streptomyces sp. DSM 41529]MDT0550116.1 hypothetical protein [Streptomyces sp. DSM 41529]